MTQKKQNRQESFWRSKRAIQILCLIIASVFWFLTKLSKDFEHSRSYKLVYELPESKSLASIPPDSARIYYRGEGWDLFYMSMQNSRSQVRLPLDDRARQNVSKDHIQNVIANDYAHHSLDISSIVVPNQMIEIEDKIQKKLPIVIGNELGQIPSYHLQSLQISPDSVVVIGPVSILDKMSVLKTEVFDISTDITNYELTLNLNQAANPLVKLSHSAVDITAKFEQLTEKEFEIPITILNTDREIQLFPNKVKLQCSIGISKFDSLTLNDFKAIVDFKELADPLTGNEVIIHITEISPHVVSYQFNPKLANFIIVENEPEGLSQ